MITKTLFRYIISKSNDGPVSMLKHRLPTHDLKRHSASAFSVPLSEMRSKCRQHILFVWAPWSRDLLLKRALYVPPDHHSIYYGEGIIKPEGS